MLSLINRTRGKKATIPGYLVFILFGGVICFMVFQKATEDYRFRQSGISIPAKIEGFSNRNGAFTTLNYVYDFAGKRYRVSERMPVTRERAFKAGESVKVWIQPEQPKESRLARRGIQRHWFGFLFGGSLMIAGLFGLRQHYRNRKG